MSKDKQKYLEAYIPEVKPKETPKRSGMKRDGRLDEIEEAIRAFNDLLTKQNRDNLDAMYNIDMDNMSSSMRRLFQSYDDGITKANASIETWADAQEAGFKEVAEWQNQTNKSISYIEGKADANTASITLLNQWKTDASSSLTAVQTKASQNEAQITALASWKNTAEDEIDGLAETMAVIEVTADENGARIDQIVSAIGEDGEVTFASIAAGIAEDESFVDIIADKVNITADMLVLDSNLYITGMDGDETMMKIMGNRIWLNHIRNADTGAGLSWWYDGIDTGSVIGGIRSERDTWLNDDMRYSLRLDALRTNNDYPCAIMLFAEGAITHEAGTRICLTAPKNVRIEAQDSYFIACTTNFDGIVPNANSFVFCTDGIYYTYLNSDDEIEYECILPISV